MLHQQRCVMHTCYNVDSRQLTQCISQINMAVVLYQPGRAIKEVEMDIRHEGEKQPSRYLCNIEVKSVHEPA